VLLQSSAIVRTIIHCEGRVLRLAGLPARFGEPASPQDLLRHRCLRLRTPGMRLRPLRLIDPGDGDRSIELEVPAVVQANHTDTLLRATLDGAGISSQPMDLIAPLLKSGALRRLLAPWVTNRLSLVAALPSRKFMPVRTRAFLDHLVEHTRRSLSELDVLLAGSPSSYARAGTTLSPTQAAPMIAFTATASAQGT